MQDILNVPKHKPVSDGAHEPEKTFSYTELEIQS